MSEYGKNWNGFFGGAAGGGGGSGTVTCITICGCGGTCVLGTINSCCTVTTNGVVSLCSVPPIIVQSTGTCSGYRCCVNNDAKASCSYSFGGQCNVVETNAVYGVILGGFLNCLKTNSSYGFVAQGCENIICDGIRSTILNGYQNCSCGEYNSILGGARNISSECYSIISSGLLNRAQTPYSSVGSGSQNRVSCCSPYSTISNGYINLIQTTNSNYYKGYNTISSGYQNCIIGSTAYLSTIINGCNNTINLSTSNSGYYGNAFTGSGYLNRICGDGDYGFIGTGIFNTVSGFQGAIVGGGGNCAIGCQSFIGGGVYNIACAYRSAIVGGADNCVCGCNSFVGAGADNRIDQARWSATVSGDYNCILDGAHLSFIGSGTLNTIGCLSEMNFIGVGCCNEICANNTGLIGSNNCLCHDSSIIMGSNITSQSCCTLHANCLWLGNIPTSPVGLSAGHVWYDTTANNVLKIV